MTLSSPPIVLPTPEAMERAVRLLKGGDLVAFPTETVYGLGADAGNERAVRAIFAAKGRPADHPVIVHLADASGAASWAREMPEGARRLADAFWPGPLTLVLPRSPRASDAVTGGQDSVGLRVPAHPVARDLLRAFARAGGSGVAAPSANRFGRISPTTARHVADDMGGDVALILDGGACDVGIESTIVAFDARGAMLLRPGGIAAAELARVLGAAPRIAPAGAPRASGTLASHYAPRTASRLVDAGELAGLIAHDAAEYAVLARTAVRPARIEGSRWIAAPGDPVRYAHDLYANLRSLDAVRAATILIEAVPDDPAWQAVRDRLARATHGDDDDRD
ncbi:MAG TPA: L-threonylcarbamoyladenylate synthase [Casimicrobiaceae bacterium]|nr:L-threonylcarbamoyladenylate synthase [Casimicrobiaceae bacterium]